MIALNTALWLLAAVWLVPAAVFTAECLLACLPCRRRQASQASDGPAPRIAVLIPAHDEEAAMAKTVRHLAGRLRPGDRVLVVADNCTDGTTRAARAAGADVTERFDSLRRGKGFALAHGFGVLSDDPPDVVFVLDADCRTGPGTIRDVSASAHANGRPVQSLNLCRADRRGIQAVSELSLRFKNLIRPLGLARLGLPCHLMGTGMALPWRVVERLPAIGDDLAEDMRLGVELALAGTPPLFSTAGRVESALPTDVAGFVTQRTRWEQGHLRTLLTHAPRLIAVGLRRRRIDVLALGLDLLVPPLTLLVFAWVVLLGLSSIAATIGASAGPAYALGCGGLALVGSVGLGWSKFCRRRVPIAALAALPGFVLRKVPIYARFLTGRRQTGWVRTPRANEASKIVKVS